MQRRTKVIIEIIVALLIIAGIWIYYSMTAVAPISVMELPIRNGTLPEVPMLAVYPHKIVYTADVTQPKDLYMGDCSMRGGVFNRCGNGCGVDEKNCTMTCALICTLPEEAQ